MRCTNNILTSASGSSVLNLASNPKRCQRGCVCLALPTACWCCWGQLEFCRNFTCQPQYSFVARFGCPEAFKKAEMVTNLAFAATDLAALVASFLTMLKPWYLGYDPIMTLNGGGCSVKYVWMCWKKLPVVSGFWLLVQACTIKGWFALLFLCSHMQHMIDSSLMRTVAHSSGCRQEDARSTW